MAELTLALREGLVLDDLETMPATVRRPRARHLLTRAAVAALVVASVLGAAGTSWASPGCGI